MDRAQNEINQSRQDARQRQADKDAADMEALNAAGNATAAFAATTYSGDSSGSGDSTE
jgi:hypothetical protein